MTSFSAYAATPVRLLFSVAFRSTILDPGSRPTVKCRGCAHWSHKECVGSMKDFTCQLCRIQREQIALMTTAVDSAIVSHDSPSPLGLCTVSREIEEITVATKAVDSAVVSHESPSEPEFCTASRNVVCTVCQEAINIHNDAQCKCRGVSSAFIIFCGISLNDLRSWV
jgi:hypothetical protein